MESVEGKMPEDPAVFAFHPLRKVWHVIGTSLIIFLFHLLKGVTWPVAGPTLLMGVAWMETAAAFAMEIVRFSSPREEEAIERLPFVRRVMRGDEKRHVNASTWLMLATALMATGYWLGWCGEAAVTGALVVVALADPAASWARHQARRRGSNRVRAAGLCAFFLCALAGLAATGWVMGAPWRPWSLAAAALAGTWAESDLLRMAGWVLGQIRRMPVPHPAATGWLSHIYPDDNLLIPLAVTVTMAVLAGW